MRSGFLNALAYHCVRRLDILLEWGVIFIIHHSIAKKLYPYIIMTISVSFLTIVLHEFAFPFDLVNIALLYLFPVLVSAVRWGMGPSFYAAGIGVLAFDFFFVPPVFSFTVADLRYVVSFAVFLSVATLTTSLASMLRLQLNNAKQRETITTSLYALSRQMTVATDLHAVLESIVRQISETVHTQAAIYMPNHSGELHAATDHDANCVHTDSDRAIVNWVYSHGHFAGRGTPTLRESPNLFVPLRTENQVHGVLAVYFSQTTLPVTSERLRLIEALAGLGAMAISRIALQEEAKIAHVSAESERLRTAILDSISHELRTPLSTIIGAVTGLQESGSMFSQADQNDLLSTIHEGAMRMNRLVTNLLGMVRLESGMLLLRKNWCDLEDIVGVALTQINDALQQREVHVTLQKSLPLLSVDDVLIETVLVNVLSNAIKYSSDTSHIFVTAIRNGEFVEIMIEDQGIGVPSSEAELIFEKFYRLQSAKSIPGTGLGLAICKGIIEAHGGTIRAASDTGQGTTITISLPYSDPPALQDDHLQEEGDENGKLWRQNSGY